MTRHKGDCYAIEYLAVHLFCNDMKNLKENMEVFMAGGGKILFMTVGTGDAANLEKSLINPLKKSILKGEWQEVVLLPSQETAQNAERLCQDLCSASLIMEPLPGRDMENNADQTYAHFEAVIASRIAAGVSATQMVADFTRGTKAMSAALVLAAARHGIPRLRYIIGQRNSVGSVMAGTEIVQEFSTMISSGHRLLDQARLAMDKGNFAAILDILPDVSGPMAGVWPQDVRELSLFGRWAAMFYGAWDRLDYAEAKKVLDRGIPTCPDSAWQRYVPSDAIKDYVRRLAMPRPATEVDCATWVWPRVADLLANGERRIRDRQFEDASLRAYRILELMGQAQLFAHGLDSAQLPPDNEHVAALARKLEERKENRFGVDRKTGNYTAPRELAARLLKSMQDPLGGKLLKLGQGPLAWGRNKSLLIHGFEVTQQGTDQSRQSLQKDYASLETLLLETWEDAAAVLCVARSVDFSVVAC